MIQSIRNQGVAAYTFGVIAVSVLTILTLFTIEAVAPFSNSTDRANAWVCLSMTATPSTVQEGESTTLRWNFGAEQGVTVTIDQLPGQVFQGGSGSVVVTPTKTTEYRAVAHMEGNPITFDCCVVVKVIPATDPCEFVDLAIEEKSFTFTGPPALSHYTAKFCDGTTSGKVEGSWGDKETITFQKELKYVSVKAAECVLEKQRECTPPAPDPWCEMNVSPTTIQQGNSTLLSWESGEVTSVDIPGVGTDLLPTDSKNVTPATTTTYVGTFHTKKGDTISCDATVTVTPKPVDPDPWCEMNIAPQTIQEGDSAVLSWNSGEIQYVDIPGVGTGLPYTGTHTVSPATTTTYTGAFKTKVGSSTIYCDTTVTVTEKPVDPDPWCDMNVAPSLIYEGESATLSWTSEYVTSVDIAGIGDGLAASSSTSVSPATTTTYTGVFHTEKGSTISCDATVEVIPEGQDPEPICAMSISPSTVLVGESATLTWETENTTTGSIDQGIGSVGQDGSRTVTVNANTTYTGVWEDAEGDTVTCSASVSIRRGGGPCINCGDDDDDEDEEEEDEDDPKEPSIVLGKNITKTGSFITLNQVPYTGFEATPAMTALFWITVLAVSAFIAYVLTRVRLLDRIRTRFAQNTAPEEYHYLDYAQMQATPSPYANELTTMHSTVAPHDKPSDITEQIEDIAHGESVLLSPEALRIIRTHLEGNGLDVSSYLGEVFEKAKAEFPREDGWILLSKERMEQLVYGSAHQETHVSVVADTKYTQTPMEVNQMAQDESTQNKMVRDHVSSLQSGSVTQTVSNHTNNVVARFIQNLVHVEKKEAFDLLRNISNKGVDVGVFMTLVVRNLDEVYKDRIEGNRSPDAELVKKTASWSTEDFETILGILVECVDYSYSNNRIGTKIALAKAFEHFEKK